VLTNQAYKIIRDKDIVKDILQDVYVTLYTRRNELPASINIAGYLRNAVKYKVSTILRDKLSRDGHHHHLFSMGQQAELNQPYPYEGSALQKRIRAGVEALPEKCRQAFILSHYEGMSYNAIAREMGISVKTVEKHIGKALQTLRRQLTEEQCIYLAVATLALQLI
jgi:RNA polymerase sigma-70 factor (ECF subfamily)